MTVGPLAQAHGRARDDGPVMVTINLTFADGYQVPVVFLDIEHYPLTIEQIEAAYNLPMGFKADRSERGGRPDAADHSDQTIQEMVDLATDVAERHGVIAPFRDPIGEVMKAGRRHLANSGRSGWLI